MSMRLNRAQLRELIEAEVDKMRLPRGPNSRDDAEDKPLLDDESESVNEAAVSDTDISNEIAGQVGEFFNEQMETYFSAAHTRPGTFGRMRLKLEDFVRDLLAPMRP